MWELKPLSREAIPGAVEKAERYRLLNEPVEAESICLDVLEISPDHHGALVILLLALTDQFERDLAGTMRRAFDVLPRLLNDYERAYYTGIVHERRAKTQLRHGAPTPAKVVHDGFCEAMRWYERAEAIRPPGNDDAILRWNACARVLLRHTHLHPTVEDRFEPYFE